MVSAKKPRKAEAKAKTKLKTNAPATAAGLRKKKKHAQLLLQPPRSSRTRVPKTNVHDDTTNAKTTTSTSTDGSSWDSDHELRQVQALLAQIWHRNKNQHRGQKWWKWVSVLKRRVRDLVKLTVDDGTGDGTRRGGKVKSGAEGGGEESEAVRARKRLELERVRAEQRRLVEEWVREVVLGRCWLAFSTLVADPQFSTLGVVLLAILARVGRLVGLPAQPPLPPAPGPDLLNPAAPEQPDTLPLLATSLAQTAVDVDRGEVVERASDGRGRPGGSTSGVGSKQESVVVEGRVMRGKEAGDQGAMEIETREDELSRDGREEDEMGSRLLVASTGDSEKIPSKRETPAYDGIRGKEPSAAAERKKKRRKKGNAIDELFAGLS